MDLKNVAAVVTGGASGLGGATAELLAARGARVTILDLGEEQGKARAQAIGGHFIRLDITDEQAVDAALAGAEAAHGPARILVNCAGIIAGARVIAKDGTPHPLATFRRVLDVNVAGTFTMLTRFAARLIAHDTLGEERGIIINTASVAAFDGQIGQAAYAASKAAIAGLTLPLARDLAQHAIRVMTIAPGVFWTPMVGGMSQAVQDSLGKQTPFPARLGKPEEFAMLVASIIENPMLNGETIRLDGAIRMAPR